MKLVLSIKGLDLWWVELGFLDAIYIMGRVPSLPQWPNLSLGCLSAPLRIKERTWWLGRRIISQLCRLRDCATFGIHFVMESGIPKTSFSLIMIKRLCMYEIFYGIKLDLTISIRASPLSDYRDIKWNFWSRSIDCWNLLLMIHLWRHIIWSSISKPIQEFYMLKTSQRELIMMCIVIVDSMLKALKHTHKS